MTRGGTATAEAGSLRVPNVAPLVALQAETDPTGLAIFRDLFAPGLQHDAGAYHGRTWVDVDGEGWRKINRDVPMLLAAHVAAGASGEPVDVGKGRELRSLALSVAPGEHVRVLNLDVDGAVYPARDVVAALFEVTDGAAMIVPGSGAAGRCRVLVPLEHRLPVAQAHALGVALCTAVRFAPASGGVEVYPHPTRQTRLPFGLGAAVELDANLQPVRREHPITLSRDLVDRRRRVDLPALVERIGGRAVVQVLQEVLQDVVDARSVASPAKRKATTTKRSASTVPRTVHAAADAAQVLQWWREGVAGENERDVALFPMLCDCRDRGLSLSQAQRKIADWIRGGGLARANHEHHNVENEIKDAHRRAREVYKRPPRGRPKPLHLTAREIVDVVSIAEQVAPVVGRTVAEVGEFLLRVLPRFKGAHHAGQRDVRVHRDEWFAAAGRAGRSYRRLRDAVGLFGQTSGYLSMAKLRARGCSSSDAQRLAHAATWSCTFTFDTTSPARPIGGPSWAMVRLAAERKHRRDTARVTPKSPKLKREAPPRDTHLDEESSSPVRPVAAAGLPLRSPGSPSDAAAGRDPVSFSEPLSTPARSFRITRARDPVDLHTAGRIDGDPAVGYGGSDAPRR